MLEFFAVAFVIVGKSIAFFQWIPIMLVICMGLFFSWFWTLGTSLHPKLPATVKMNLSAFKFFLLFPLVYLLFFLFLVSGFFGMGWQSGPMALDFMPAIFLLHLFASFCMFYCLYFISKELKSVEWQRPVTFSDYAGEFFLIWFYPIGVWFIQPKINKLFDSGPEQIPE